MQSILALLREAWIGTDKDGLPIAICFKGSLSNKQLKLLKEWWRRGEQCLSVYFVEVS